MAQPRINASAKRPGRTARVAYLALAYVCVALGLLGVVLPLVPTTPFLLLAAWSASRGSPKLHAWLYAHPYIGKVIKAWERERAVPRSAKLSACVLLALSWAAMWWMTGDWRLLTLTGCLFALLLGFLLTRPEPNTKRIT